jgi:hypothetical protein
MPVIQAQEDGYYLQLLINHCNVQYNVLPKNATNNNLIASNYNSNQVAIE